MKTKRKGGSAQDRRRARRAAERQALAVAAADGIEKTGIEVPADGTEVELAACLCEGEHVCQENATAVAEVLSPERVALARVQQFLMKAECACGHSFVDHLGADGPCKFEDGRGMCSCSAYSEAPEEASIVAASFGPDRLDAAALALAGDDDGLYGFVRMRLDNFALVAAPAAELPDELQPGETLPERNPSPTDLVPEQRLGSDRSEIHWTADLVLEGVLTEDGRAMAPGSLTWRELPLTLMAMIETQEGHDGAQVAGRIDEIWREGNVIKAGGVFDAGEFGLEIARMVDDRTLRGNSVDIAVLEHEFGPKSDWFDADGNWAPKEDSGVEPTEADMIDLLFGGEEDAIFVVTKGVIGASTVCPFPAFADAKIEVSSSLVAAGSPAIWTFTQQSGATLVMRPLEPADAPEEQETATEGLTAAAAGLAPLRPPADWFRNPELKELTPLTVDADGRITGHAWAWDVCHIGIPDACTTAPHSHTENAYYHLKEVECEDGSRISCGTVTLEAPHADRRLGRADASAHYDNTGLAVADVICGEDEFGGWVAGALRPDVSEEKARALRGAVLSGDWRNVNGNLELVALLAVNVPGFPVPRTRALVASGDDGNQVLALVAAGIHNGPLVPDDRMTDAARAKIAALGDAAAGRYAELAARARG